MKVGKLSSTGEKSRCLDFFTCIRVKTTATKESVRKQEEEKVVCHVPGVKA